jgi:hypothetical protein
MRFIGYLIGEGNAMKLTKNNLVEICSEVTSMLGDILAQHVELNEGVIDDVAMDTAQNTVARLKKQTDDAKEQLQKIKQAQRRRRELEKLRSDHEREANKREQNESKTTQRTIQLLDSHGHLIGKLMVAPSGDVSVYDSKGKFISREVGNGTCDRSGKFRRGRQALVLLGQSLAGGHKVSS